VEDRHARMVGALLGTGGGVLVAPIAALVQTWRI